METRAIKLAACLALSLLVQSTPVLAGSGLETSARAKAVTDNSTEIVTGGANTGSCDSPAASCDSPQQTTSFSASQFPIANFERVNSILLRGATPSDRGLEALRDSGVKTIINLRTKSDGVANEESKVKKFGMKYVSIPLGFATPDTATIGRILRIITNKEMQPVFVHCRQGADRTGMIVGMYRMLVDNWEFKDAYTEMRKHHFKPFLLVLKEAVRTCQAQGELLAAVGIDRADNNKRLVGSLENRLEAADQ